LKTSPVNPIPAETRHSKQDAAFDLINAYFPSGQNPILPEDLPPQVNGVSQGAVGRFKEVSLKSAFQEFGRTQIFGRKSVWEVCFLFRNKIPNKGAGFLIYKP